jgi:DNA-binding response OmpR family regulator
MARILVVDDDEQLLLLLRQVLQKAGFEVLSTADGPQGIEIYQRERPDLVLLDVGLPTMDGIEVLKSIISHDEDAKIIVFTAYAAEWTSTEAYNHGACDFIEKPVRPDILLGRIRSALQQSDEEARNPEI